MNDHDNWHDEHAHEQQAHDEAAHEEAAPEEIAPQDPVHEQPADQAPAPDLPAHEEEHEQAPVASDLDEVPLEAGDAGAAMTTPGRPSRPRVACSRPTTARARQIRLARLAQRDIRLALGPTAVPLAPAGQESEAVVTSRVRLTLAAPRVHLPTAQLALATRRAMSRGAEPAQAARLQATMRTHEVRGLIQERMSAQRVAATLGATVRTGEQAGARVTERVAHLRDDVREQGHSQRDRVTIALHGLIRRAMTPAQGALGNLRERAGDAHGPARRLLDRVGLQRVDLPKVDLHRVEVVDLREPLQRVVEDLEELRGELRTGAERAANRAGEALGTVEQRAADAAHEARERASDAAHEARGKVSEAAHEARDRATEAAQEAQERASEALTRARAVVHR